MVDVVIIGFIFWEWVMCIIFFFILGVEVIFKGIVCCDDIGVILLCVFLFFFMIWFCFFFTIVWFVWKFGCIVLLLEIVKFGFFLVLFKSFFCL